MQTDVISGARVAVLQTPVVWFMALAAALGTATIYPLQPAIADMAGSLHASLPTVGALAVALAVRTARIPRRTRAARSAR